jgi:hypothetical protein
MGGQENIKALIPDGKIRISGVDFTSLLFKQIDRIDESTGFIFKVLPQDRPLALATRKLHIEDLEILMWAKLENDPHFMEERKLLGLDDPKVYSYLAKTDLGSALQFITHMNNWYRLLTKYMKKFNFYPPTDTGFIAGKKEVQIGKIKEDEE